MQTTCKPPRGVDAQHRHLQPQSTCQVTVSLLWDCGCDCVIAARKLFYSDTHTHLWGSSAHPLQSAGMHRWRSQALHTLERALCRSLHTMCEMFYAACSMSIKFPTHTRHPYTRHEGSPSPSSGGFTHACACHLCNLSDRLRKQFGCAIPVHLFGPHYAQ